jgi:glycosyltransferase involved in cell wall biosynthesis
LNSFSFIISTHNNEKDIANTYLTVIEALSKLNVFEYEIIFVNNASTDKTEERIFEIKRRDNKVRYCFEPRIGLSYAIFTGVNLSQYEFSLPLPGHDMFTSESILNVCALAEPNCVILGSRVAKLKSRPIIKVLASYAYTFICNKLFQLKLSDINGLILFPTELLKVNIDPTAGHGHAIYPIVRLSRVGVKIHQVQVRIKENHKSRPGTNWMWHVPRLSNVLSALRTLYVLKRNK